MQLLSNEATGKEPVVENEPIHTRYVGSADSSYPCTNTKYLCSNRFRCHKSNKGEIPSVLRAAQCSREAVPIAKGMVGYLRSLYYTRST